MVKGYWYDGYAWQATAHMWVWDGTTWQPVKNVWIRDSGAGIWRLFYTSASISGLNGFDLSGDPSLGNLDIRWSVSGDTSPFTIDIDADFSGGTTYGYNIVTGYTLAYLGDYDASSLVGAPGFSSLNSTNIRVRLMDGSTILTELTMAGPYPS